MQLTTAFAIEDGRFQRGIPASYYTDNRAMRQVSALKVEGSVDVYVRRGATLTMTVAAECAEDLAKVKTTFKGDILAIGSEGFTLNMGGGSMNFFGSATVNGVRIGAFKGKVAVAVVLPGIDEVSVRGSADVALLDLVQDAVELDIQGSGDIFAQGTVGSLRADIAGSGSVKAKALIVERAVLKVAGSGDIKAQVREKVKAHVSGSGDIKIFGSPIQRDTNVSGSGDIRFQ